MPVPPPGVRCLRCGRTTPPLPRGVLNCPYCSAPLPVQRWRADPPISAPTAGRRRPVRRRTYAGPPSYRGNPGWGFPPVVWRSATATEATEAEPASSGLIRAAQYVCVVTFVAALAAAGGEAWRYALLLRGRTEVLSGPLVAASDRLVAIAASSATVLALIAAAVVLPALVRLHGVAARRSDRGPSRAPASVLARLVVPGWNIYGLGVVTGEIDSMLASPRSAGRPRLSRLVVALWGCWVANAVLVLLTLGRAFGRSEQAMADTVELHICLDLVGAVVALLCALLFRRFRRRLEGAGAGELRGWVVCPPAATRGGVTAIHRSDPADPPARSTDASPGQPAMVSTAPASAATSAAASATRLA